MKFRNLKNKIGSALLEVVTTMAVLSICGLAAAGIALTNYRTTATYTSQDAYFYSAEAGQAQLTTHIRDAAYNAAATADWTKDNAYKNYYEYIKEDTNKFLSESNGTYYNEEYKVYHEIITENFANEDSCDFTIKTIVESKDGSTQEYESVITIKAPTANGEEIIKDTSGIFNKGYAVAANGSAKNTEWYGLWGGFNTYYTQKVKGTSPVNSSNNLSSIYTSESSNSTDKNYQNSGIYHWLGTSNDIAKNPSNFNPIHKFDTNGSKFNQSNVSTKVDGLTVDVEKLIKFANGADKIQTIKQNSYILNSTNTSTQGYNKYYAAEEKYYYKANGNFTLGFGAKSEKTSFDGLQPGEFYRVVYGAGSHALAYQFNAYGSGMSEVITGFWKDYTYYDHYYQNKMFFFDLGGSGTLTINNSFRSGITVEDAWGNKNKAAAGNIVLENCIFVVNGNIKIDNAFNFSNCKVFATGDITLDSVYYLDGLLSAETDAGSNIIKQSLYYCEGVFESKLISRYAMDWALEKNGRYTKLDGKSYLIHSEWQKECLISNGNTHMSNGYTGLLATYRYPTVLKAVIIAKGSKDFKNIKARYTKNDNVSTTSINVNNVSVFLNPNGSVDGVVDAILIEGQIYSKNKILVANYNDAVSTGWGEEANRFAASSQIQYHDYQHGSFTFEKLNDTVMEQIFGNTPVIIINSGIYRK